MVATGAAKGRKDLADFNKAVAVFNPCHDGRKCRHDPVKQNPVGGVADSQPDDNRCSLLPPEAVNKVLVLCDDRRFVFLGVVPYSGVFGMAHSEVFEMLGMVTFSGDDASQTRRQLSVDKKADGIQAVLRIE